MRSFCAFLALFLALGAAPAWAEAAAASEPDAAAQPAGKLDALFAELKRESNEKAAERIAARIGEELRHSGSASIDLMMQWADEAAQKQKFDVALDFLDQVTVLSPQFAEGWNRRATVHFMMNNYRKSMADIDRTLQLEPRHFGALAGMAAIMRNTGRNELALQAWERVLEIYPMMRAAQDEVAKLAEELAGETL